MIPAIRLSFLFVVAFVLGAGSVRGQSVALKTLPSGLQYRVEREGIGASPGPTDTVTVNYRGTLADGTEFDSSYKRGQPATFRLNGVIKGWTEGLQLMKEGGKASFIIPGKLAYGEEGMGNLIKPNATLYFTIELLSVKK